MITMWCAAFWILVSFLCGLGLGYLMFPDDDI